MSHSNMAGMNGAGGPMGAMPVMNNGANGATPRLGGEQEDQDYEGKLNANIYEYFIRKELFDCARALRNSGVSMTPPLRGRDGDMNGADDNAMQTDSKDDMDSKRPDDLPAPLATSSDVQGPPFLLEWFALFWDVWNAQRRRPIASAPAMQYVQHTQAQRLRNQQQAQLMNSSMQGIMPADYQMMRLQQANGMQMNGDLRAKAMQNRGNAAFQPTPHQLAQLKSAQIMQQQAMRRDPSDMDVNGQRARTPSSGDNAPSPSKRPRIENVPFNGQQMMQNGRGPLPGMQGQQMREAAMNNQANQLLMNNGINPDDLTPGQISSFQAQPPTIQAKSIQVFNQNLARTNGSRQGMPTPGMPGQGSPIMQPGFDMGTGVPDYINNQAIMRGGVGGNANGGNHALQDYQMQLMLLEQQNKKRLLMARQEQETISRPDGQPMSGGPGYMSPSGSRSGPSPGPNEQMGKRVGTPKMGPSGMPGSPMPDGSMPQARGSPAPMSFNGQMPAEMYTMNGMGVGPNGIRLPPSSHPGPMAAGGFPAAQAQQQMEALRAQAQATGRMPNGQQWPQGPPQGQPPMMQPNQAQPPAQVGTPNQRNAMPPPQAVPAATGANGARPTSPAQGAPPTPQTTNKAAPKKKDTKETRKRPNKKNSTASVAATPGEPENPTTPVPPTPSTPQHPNSFQKAEAPSQAAAPPVPNPVAPAPGLAPPQPDVNAIGTFGLDGTEGQYNMVFGDPGQGGDVLDNFDFDSFLHDDAGFDFDPTSLAFPNGDGVEAGAEGA